MGEFCGLLGGSEMSQASESKSSLSADIEIFIVYRFSLATRDEKTSCAWDFKLCERTKMRKTLATRGMFAVSKGEEMQDCMSWTQVKLKLDSSSPSSPHVSISCSPASLQPSSPSIPARKIDFSLRDHQDSMRLGG
jgi:hypothetical protein